MLPLPRLTLSLLLGLSLLQLAPAFAQDVDALARQARAAAQSDQNGTSADLFERAIEAAPAREMEFLREYADQLTYSARSARAIPLYRRFLAATNDPPDRLRALKGLALALSWADRPTESRAVYEQVLAVSPDDVDAQRSVGRVISWSGRQREAQTYLRAYLDRRPADAEARVLLAQAQWWLGRPDSARATLSDPALVTAERADATKLARNIDRALSPATRFDVQRSTQSNRLDILVETLEHQWTSQSGLTSITPRWQHFRYGPGDGTPAITVDRPELRARVRISDGLELNAQGAAERVRPEGADGYQKLTYNTWLTWWPSDLFRLDVSADRSTFDNAVSLRRGITARGEGTSIDFLPSEQWRLSARGSRSEYSDGNRRNFLQLDAERRLFAHPIVWAGVRYAHFDFARQLDNGYFNPKIFNSYVATLRVEAAPADDARFSWRMQIAGGREYARPDGDKPVYEASIAATYRPSPATSIEVRFQRFSSRTASDSGFARSTAGINLVHAWNAW